MKQEPIIAAYKEVVDSFNEVNAKIDKLVALLPNAPVKEGEAPAKMVTRDMEKCLYVGATHLEDSRLRFGAVFHEMLRYTDEFIAQQQPAAIAAPEPAPADAEQASGTVPVDFTPGAPRG